MPDSSAKPRRFADFSKEAIQNLEGKKVAIKDIMDKELLIKAYRVFPSKVGSGKECLQMQFELDGADCVVFTNSAILIRQMAQYAGELPFLATIQKRNQYYTLS